MRWMVADIENVRTPRKNARTPRKNATRERLAFLHGIPERQAFSAGLLLLLLLLLAEMGSPILVLSGLIFPHNISPKSEVEIEMDLEILDYRISRDKLPGLKIQKLEIQCV